MSTVTNQKFRTKNWRWIQEQNKQNGRLDQLLLIVFLYCIYVLCFHCPQNLKEKVEMFLFRKKSTESKSSKVDAGAAQTKDQNSDDLKYTVYDFIRTIKDPEKPNTLEELNVVYEDGVFVKDSTAANTSVVRVEFNPTVPHCSLATLIGLCIRIKLERSIPDELKLDIFIKKGAHATEEEINKQINDKERIAAAMENPKLKEMVEMCIKEEY